MNNFNNSAYHALVIDLLADAYNETSSISTRISVIRRYIEVVVRKLLDLPEGTYMTLENARIQSQISNLPNGNHFINTLTTILRKLNDSSHTQILTVSTSTELYEIADKLFDLLAIFHINYFDEFAFGSNEKVTSAFSLLPPIIRYKILIFLYNKTPNNIAVIDKLTLATLKSHNKACAIEWIKAHKNELLELSACSEDAANNLSAKYGKNFSKEFVENSPNMYELCLNKVNKVNDKIKQNGLLYNDFESALPYYEEFGKVKGDSTEIVKFNDIMDFLYLGRKKAFHEISKDPQSYLTLSFL